MRKPHPKSRLKTLPPDRQKELYNYLSTHTLDEAEAWLATDGLDTNRTSLSEFFSWYPLASKLQGAASMGSTVKEILRELPGLNLDEHQLSKAGQAIFEADAIESNDSKLYVALRSLRQTDLSLELQAESAKTKARQKDAQIKQKDQDLKLSERRVAMLEKKFADAQKTLSDPSLSMPERERRMKEMFGISA